MIRDSTSEVYVFGSLLNDFFNKYLLSVKGASKRTADSYRYSFIAFGKFIEKKGLAIDRLKFKDLTVEFVEEFLADLELQGNTVATRNQRQAALNSYFKFVMNRYPDLRDQLYLIKSIPMKKATHKEVGYVKAEGLSILFSMPDKSKLIGIRDLSMILLMATIGLRVSELISIKALDLNLNKPCTVRVHGKGNKERLVYLPDQVVNILTDYLAAAKIDLQTCGDRLLFANEYGFKFCRQNINRLVEHYATLAREHISLCNLDSSLIPEKLTPHMLRHSAAMNMLSDSSVTLAHIKLMLGHASIQATEIYAKATNQQVRDSMDRVVSQFIPEEKAIWKDQEVKQAHPLDNLRALNFKDSDDETANIVGFIPGKKRQ